MRRRRIGWVLLFGQAWHLSAKLARATVLQGHTIALCPCLGGLPGQRDGSIAAGHGLAGKRSKQVHPRVFPACSALASTCRGFIGSTRRWPWRLGDGLAGKRSQQVHARVIRACSALVSAFGGLNGSTRQCPAMCGRFGGLAAQTDTRKSYSAFFELLSGFGGDSGVILVGLAGARAKQVQATSYWDSFWPRLRAWVFCPVISFISVALPACGPNRSM